MEQPKYVSMDKFGDQIILRVTFYKDNIGYTHFLDLTELFKKTEDQEVGDLIRNFKEMNGFE